MQRPSADQEWQIPAPEASYFAPSAKIVNFSKLSILNFPPNYEQLFYYTTMQTLVQPLRGEFSCFIISLEWICYSEGKGGRSMKKQKTALVLGGGGARGAYEVGVWQALRELDIPLDIVVGTSVGAINGALVMQDDFDLAVKLWHELQTDQIWGTGFFRKEEGRVRNLLVQYLNEEAIRKSPMDYGMAAVTLPSIKPRHFYIEDIPKGKLADYIMASSSLFPAIKAQDIDQTKYVDGGYLDNLPVDMALKKGASFVIAVDLSTGGLVRKEPLRQAETLIHLRSSWDLGSILAFDGVSATRNIRLGYLETLKAFGFYDGTYYSLSKGEFGKRDLAAAEAAGKVFGLSPTTLYKKTTFETQLLDTVVAYRRETEKSLTDFHEQIKGLRLDGKSLLNLLGKLNEKTLTLLILDYLKEHPNNRDALLSKSMRTLFKRETTAAGYLFRI